MLFPYAQCNLRQYMSSEGFGLLTKGNIMWLLRQFRGLAEALKDIHNLSIADTAATASTAPTLAALPPGTQKAGWHHDLKPENILFFSSTGSARGSFRVADFGSSKIHTYRSGSVNTHSPNGTLTYEPPEAKIEGAMSRPYDVWSLGCVFLELLIWAILDFPSVKKFANERYAKRSPGSPTDILEDDGFWQMAQDTTVTLRKPVLLWIQTLKEMAAQQQKQPFKEVLDLVIRMLDTNRHTRIIALDVWNTLDSIYKQKRVDLDKTTDGSKAEINGNGVFIGPLPRLSMDPPDRGTPEQTQEDRLTTSPTDLFPPVRRSSSMSVTSLPDATSSQWDNSSMTMSTMSTVCQPGSFDDYTVEHPREPS